jgi:polyribonucleotide nucleotidyltransferase
MEKVTKFERVETELNGKTLSIETGRLAKQSNGAVIVSHGDSAVIVAVNSARPREGIDFFPLTVDYVEKIYAAGRIPGGFFKREGRLTEKEVLTSRFIDRTLRPMFPDGYADETQVHAQVIACEDGENTDMLAFLGAGAAMLLSDIPFPEPVAGVRVSRVAGEFVIHPTVAQMEEADITVIVAGSKGALVMVEGGALQVSEADMVETLRRGHEAIQKLLDLQLELQRRAGREKRVVTAREIDPALRARVVAMAGQRIEQAGRIQHKKERYAALDAIDAEVLEALVESARREPLSLANLADLEAAQARVQRLRADVKGLLSDLRSSVMRRAILEQGRRIDGRGLEDIRPIWCQVPAFPRLHGSAIFTRGETQALAATTLGGTRDEQLIEGLQETYYRRFFLHYNFPPFGVGEVRPLRGPNRREVGHGALAERALRAVLPGEDDSPYTIRLVSEVLESNGSSAMATVCSGALALMDAGIQIKAPVAGIAMGLVQEGDRFAVLSDILGDEDHLGDMDFKVAGTAEGITSIQMDIKVQGLDWQVMQRALEQARRGRLAILERMAAETADALPGFRARSELSPSAPRVEVLWIKPDKIRDLIGPGGKVIRAIQESSSSKIDVEDSGRVMIFSPDREALERARRMVEEITQEPEPGRIYVGKVKSVKDFGAFVEIFPGTEGLLHISEMADRRVEKVEDICVEGDEVLVKVLDVEPSGKIRLSRRAALAEGVEAARR